MESAKSRKKGDAKASPIVSKETEKSSPDVRIDVDDARDELAALLLGVHVNQKRQGVLLGRLLDARTGLRLLDVGVRNADDGRRGAGLARIGVQAQCELPTT